MRLITSVVRCGRWRQCTKPSGACTENSRCQSQGSAHQAQVTRTTRPPSRRSGIRCKNRWQGSESPRRERFARADGLVGHEVQQHPVVRRQLDLGRHRAGRMPRAYHQQHPAQQRDAGEVAVLVHVEYPDDHGRQRPGRPSIASARHRIRPHRRDTVADQFASIPPALPRYFSTGFHMPAECQTRALRTEATAMIPALTFIVAAYVITRMVELYSNEAHRGDSARGALQACAAVTILVALWGCWAVQSESTEVETAMSGLPGRVAP